MSATKYTYSIQNDTPNHKVAPDRLTQEIQQSAIVTALDHIDTNGDVLDIWFKDVLSSGDQTILTGIVNTHSGEPLPENQTINTNIVSSAITLPSQEKGFQDLSGHNVYRFGHLYYTATAGKTTIRMEKFTSTMYIQGGGVSLPEFVYVGGAKVENKPEHGDYCCFDLVDVDNVVGYGKTATISNVARASNVATITTTSTNTFAVGEKICINASDDTFDDMEVVIATVPDNTHFTYANTGDDVAEKTATGTVGKVVVLAPFVPRDYVFPGMVWECTYSDAKAFPAGIYLRFRYVSTGSTDVIVLPHYNLRT
jgi:hypothetical protein